MRTQQRVGVMTEGGYISLAEQERLVSEAAGAYDFHTEDELEKYAQEWGEIQQQKTQGSVN